MCCEGVLGVGAGGREGTVGLGNEKVRVSNKAGNFEPRCAACRAQIKKEGRLGWP